MNELKTLRNQDAKINSQKVLALLNKLGCWNFVLLPEQLTTT
ncbi:hypothetical protein Ple7327_0054 [Pleurocapsa sp. PCC 7327]|nr:hypothetical protein Ple7327_0054 [Pleurocapsa sp. PCC 7327]